jgi:hypothetical protein
MAINPSKDWKAPVMPWHHSHMLARMEACRSMLYVHGALSEKENDLVLARIVKWVQNAPSKSKEPLPEPAAAEGAGG